MFGICAISIPRSLAEIVFSCAREFSGRSEPRVWNCGDLLFDRRSFSCVLESLQRCRILIQKSISSFVLKVAFFGFSFKDGLLADLFFSSSSSIGS